MPQSFNVQTISSAYFVASLTLAVIMVWARATRRVYPGFNHWVASQVVLAAGVVVMSWAHVSPGVLLLAGNSLLMLALVFVHAGCIRFFDLPRHRLWPWVGLFAAAVAALAWLIGTHASASLRSLVFSLFTAVVMARVLLALVTHSKRRRDPSVLLLAAAVLVALVFFSGRSLILLYVGPDAALWNQRLLAAAFYVGIVYSILLVSGFLQLVQARTEAELQAAQADAEALANVDRLTGAWNRRRFENEAPREMARATRHAQPLSLIAFDIDHFKTINDRYGHLAGDAVLTGICERVLGRLRSTDALIRWGGDEFVIMARSTRATDAQAMARALCADLALRQFGPASKVTLSVGVAQHLPGESLDAWMARADRAIYAAKRNGRDQVMVDAAGLMAIEIAEGSGAIS